MHPAKVSRSNLTRFEDLPNIGPRMADDFVALGYTHPSQLTGVDPFELYTRLCAHTKTRQDPCVLDVFMSVASFLNGEAPRVWWDFTAERKQRYAL